MIIPEKYHIDAVKVVVAWTWWIPHCSIGHDTGFEVILHQLYTKINNAKISVDRVMQVDTGLCLLMTNNSVSSATDEMDITLKSSSVEQVDDIGS